MECLAAGRAISLPSTSTGIAKLAVRATGGYARVRSQFNLAIGRFEGVEEALAQLVRRQGRLGAEGGAGHGVDRGGGGRLARLLEGGGEVHRRRP
jgi:alkylation response protein AidB-like acyl-CoA dehydrogenase